MTDAHSAVSFNMRCRPRIARENPSERRPLAAGAGTDAVPYTRASYGASGLNRNRRRDRGRPSWLYSMRSPTREGQRMIRKQEVDMQGSREALGIVV